MKQDGADITVTLTSQDRLRSRLMPTVNLAKRWRAYLNTFLVGTAALITGSNLGIVRSLEYQAQSLMWEMRGPFSAPNDIVILAIDEESLSQAYPRRVFSHMRPRRAREREAGTKKRTRGMSLGGRRVSSLRGDKKEKLLPFDLKSDRIIAGQSGGERGLFFVLLGEE